MGSNKILSLRYLHKKRAALKGLRVFNFSLRLQKPLAAFAQNPLNVERI